MMSGSLLLEVKRLRCERGYRLLFDELSFSLKEGQLLRIGGENGSGKSTLIKVLTGLSSDYQGEIYWQGERRDKVLEQFKQQCCYLGHNKAIKKGLTVAENLAWFRRLYPCHTSEEALNKTLERLQLLPFKEMLCGQLSAGQQQRVALARLLLSRAKLWILDEPFTAVDKQGVQDFERLLAEEVQAGRSVILTTHHELQLAITHQTIVLGG